jgi:hypothetical protein
MRTVSLFNPLGESRRVAFLGHLLNVERLSPETPTKVTHVYLDVNGRRWLI